MSNKSKINTNIKIAHWNANGLKHKWTELKYFIHKHKIDIMLVNEIKASEKINFHLNGYNSIRKNRPGTSQGGGLLILINKEIKHSEFCIDFDLQTLETIGIKLENNLTIHSVYIPPQNKVNNNEIQAIMNSSSRVMAIGDFNSKYVAWNCKHSNNNGKTIYNFINNTNCMILTPETPTLFPVNNGIPSTVDFALVKNVNNRLDIDILNELDSDHHPIIIELNKTSKNYRQKQQKFTDYKNANWKKFKEIIQNELIINKNLNTPIDID